MDAPRHRSALAAGLLCAALAAACKSNEPTEAELARQIEIHTEATIGYLDMGELDRAVDQALRGLSLAPEDFKLRLFLGRALQKRGSIEDLLQAERVLRDLQPSEDFRVSLGLAEVLERKGVAFDESARGVAPGRHTGGADQATTRLRLERDAGEAWEESLAAYERALALRPNDHPAMTGALRVTSLCGDHAGALAWTDAILASTGADRGFWTSQLERPELSVRDEQSARDNIAELDELEMAVQLQAATTLVLCDRKPEAVERLDRACALVPDLAELHSRRAQLLVELGRYEEGLAAIDEYLRLSDGLAFEHPDIRRAYNLRQLCRSSLAGP
ncbi:MAG: hypothetical protein QF903_02865 [Planctomycetota bacterium]|jgi:tetratricopeptide (TPR) repeat protein|nr:hypothetical protein [Planctomycetota bacterium]MDP6762877.1 hypothetical protein [Planctomycetota bacterium]MDP6988402.1 hypothetical protein [Planctomycetota bacterium]